jgi:hypothetical protein
MTTTEAAPNRRFSKPRPKKVPENIKSWAFDSVGTRKYAVQIKKAGNGNPFLKFTEGVPQDDGTFRKFSITVWSEDFPRLFATLDEVKAFMVERNIKTPDGHKHDPRKSSARRKSGGPVG